MEITAVSGFSAVRKNVYLSDHHVGYTHMSHNVNQRYYYLFFLNSFHNSRSSLLIFHYGDNAPVNKNEILWYNHSVKA